VAREVTHFLISFCFGEFVLRLFTFREAMVMAFLFMRRWFHGDNIADRSLWQDILPDATFVLVPLKVLCNGSGAGSGCVWSLGTLQV
jgi:hypothetical protein